jgi:hypothetical protein
MKDINQTLHYLDGGSVVTIDVKNNKPTLTFSHSRKEGEFVIELDRCVIEDLSEEDAAERLVGIVQSFVGAFDKLRS